MKVSIKFLCLASLVGLNGTLAKKGGTTLLAAVALANADALSSSATFTSLKKNIGKAPAFFRRSSINSNSNININSNKDDNDNAKSSRIVDLLNIRGGACSDSDPALLFKIGTNTILESAALLGIIWSCVKLSDKFLSIPSVFNLPLLQLIASVFVIFGASLVGSIVAGGLSTATNQALMPNSIPGDPNWYANLKKPSWNPPGWLFPIMWLIVSKPTQLCALSRILKYGVTKAVAEGSGAVTTTIPLFALGVYTSHLALGDAWNKVFFGLECIGRGTVVISLFFSALLASTFLFFTIDPIAGYYMLPTCGWVAVATALQWSIYLNN